MKKDKDLKVLSIIFVILLYISFIIYFCDYTNFKETEVNIYNKLNYNNIDDLIASKIDYFYDEYNLTISFSEDIKYLSEEYDISILYDKNTILNTLEELEKYCSTYNKEFFKKFSNYGMSGITIYIVDSITANNSLESTFVRGLYKKKNTNYIIVASLENQNYIKTLHHETMHAIEDYLNSCEETFNNWYKLNPTDFVYNHIYYVNQTYSDTLVDNIDNYDVYFVDNYARSTSSEDRARIYEYISSNTSLEQYPNLNAKSIYLKKAILRYFPELNNVFNF
jgi:hypothetical protein